MGSGITRLRSVVYVVTELSVSPSSHLGESQTLIKRDKSPVNHLRGA